MELKVINNKNMQNIVIKVKNTKKVEVTLKMMESLNIRSKIFWIKEVNSWNKKVKKNLIRLKVLLFLRDSGLLN